MLKVEILLTILCFFYVFVCLFGMMFVPASWTRWNDTTQTIICGYIGGGVLFCWLCAMHSWRHWWRHQLKKLDSVLSISVGINTYNMWLMEHLPQFLPQDVAFSIHLSDNRFTARPLATTVVSPPRKLAPWVDIGTPQSASARFFTNGARSVPVLCTFRHWTTDN